MCNGEPCSTYETQILISNNHFDDLTSWSPNGGITLATVSPGYFSANAMHVSGRNANWKNPQQVLDKTELTGRNYAGKFFIKLDSDSATTVQMMAKITTNGNNAFFSLGDVNVSQAGIWYAVPFNFLVPQTTIDNADQIAIYPQVSDPNVSYTIDEMYLVEADDFVEYTSLITDGQFSTGLGLWTSQGLV